MPWFHFHLIILPSPLIISSSISPSFSLFILHPSSLIIFFYPLTFLHPFHYLSFILLLSSFSYSLTYLHLVHLVSSILLLSSFSLILPYFQFLTFLLSSYPIPYFRFLSFLIFSYPTIFPILNLPSILLSYHTSAS